jgi:hypothetical protein
VIICVIDYLTSEAIKQRGKLSGEEPVIYCPVRNQDSLSLRQGH